MNKILAALMLSFSMFMTVYAQDGDVNKGQELFKANCTACHALDKKLVGPAMKGMVTTLTEKGLDREWMYKWILNNEALRQSGDKYANEIFEEYNGASMDIFEGRLSTKDIDDILAYVENPPAPPAPPKEEAEVTSGINPIFIWIAFVSITVLLLMVLYKINALVKLKIGELNVPELESRRIKSYAEFYQRNRLSMYGGLILFGIIAFYGFWAWMMGIGVDKGYKPDQPIYFSHKIHAGVNNIDCQTCHTGAKYGKVSEIPALSTCMNCHRTISEYTGEYLESGKTREFYTSEIKKIYDHIGWNEDKQEYTGKQKPLKWVRVHNMPDFVYYNHAQHVIAADKTIVAKFNRENPSHPIDVSCKDCHGRVDTMNVIQIANDFTMGWCIDCHRKTEIDMDNGYNAAYFDKLHEKLKNEYGEEKSKITVDAIGGLECGKCHY